MASDTREKSHSVGYEEGLNGKKPPLWGGFASEDYLEGIREGYEAYLRNKDLAERVTAKTREQPNTGSQSGESEREREKREKSEERRHREFVEVLKSREGGNENQEDCGGNVDEDEEIADPLFYSSKTRRVAGVDYLNSLIIKMERGNFTWDWYENSDDDCGYEGSTPNGSYRIRICVESPYLDWARQSSKVLELKDFNVISVYVPLSREEKELCNRITNRIYGKLKEEQVEEQAALEAAEIKR